MQNMSNVEIADAHRPSLPGSCGWVAAAQVAQELGLRSRRKPPGYWDSREALDSEVGAFVAAAWTLHPTARGGGGGDSYFYNQARPRRLPPSIGVPPALHRETRFCSRARTWPCTHPSSRFHIYEVTGRGSTTAEPLPWSHHVHLWRHTSVGAANREAPSGATAT